MNTNIGLYRNNLGTSSVHVDSDSRLCHRDNTISEAVEIAFTLESKARLQYLQSMLQDKSSSFPEDQERISAVTKSLKSNDKELTEFLLTLSDNKQRTSFMLCCKLMPLDDLLEKLLNRHENGIDFTAQDVYGNTCLHYLCTRKSYTHAFNRKGQKVKHRIEQDKLTKTDAVNIWIQVAAIISKRLNNSCAFHIENFYKESCYFLLVKYGHFSILEALCNSQVQSTENQSKDKAKWFLSIIPDKTINAAHICSQWQSINRFRNTFGDEVWEELEKEALNQPGHETILHFACKNISNYKCQCGSTECSNGGLTEAQCNIHFLVGQKEFSFHQLDQFGMTSFQLAKENGLLGEIRQLGLVTVLDEVRGLDDVRKGLDLPQESEADQFLERKLNLPITELGGISMDKAALVALFEAFKTDNTTIMKHILASKMSKLILEESVTFPFLKWLRSKGFTLVQEETNSRQNSDSLHIILPSFDNGFNEGLRELATTNFEDLRHLPLVALAFKTGRLELTKLLLVTDQVSLIPNCVRVMLECQHIKMKAALSTPLLVDDMQAFCDDLLNKALNELYIGADVNKKRLIADYLLGELNSSHSLLCCGKKCIKCKCGKVEPEPMNEGDDNKTLKSGPYYRTFRLDGPRNNDSFSVMEMIKNLILTSEANGEDETKYKKLFTAPCIENVYRQMWQDSPVWKKVYYTYTILIELLFLTVFTIYLITNMMELDNKPTRTNNISFVNNTVNVASYVQGVLEAQVTYRTIFEVFLIIQWLGLFAEEIYDIVHVIKTKIQLELTKLQAYYLYNTFGNWLDWTYLVAAFLAFLSLVFARQDDGRILYRIIITNDNDKQFNYKLFDVVETRILLGIAYVSVCFRRLEILGMRFQSIGVFYITLQQLVMKDLAPFLCLLILMIVSNGVFFHCLLHHGALFFPDTGSKQIIAYDIDTLYKILTRPAYVMFGEYEFEHHTKCIDDLIHPDLYTRYVRSERIMNTITKDEDQRCGNRVGSFLYSYFLIFLFMIMTNLTMFNMLIARFSLTVNRYNDAAINIYYWSSFLKHEHLKQQGYLPLPFNMIYGFINAIASVCRSKCVYDKSDKEHNKYWDSNQPWKHSKAFQDFLLYQAHSFAGKRHLFVQKSLMDQISFGSAGPSKRNKSRLGKLKRKQHKRVTHANAKTLGTTE